MSSPCAKQMSSKALNGIATDTHFNKIVNRIKERNNRELMRGRLRAIKELHISNDRIKVGDEKFITVLFTTDSNLLVIKKNRRMVDPILLLKKLRQYKSQS